MTEDGPPKPSMMNFSDDEDLESEGEGNDEVDGGEGDVTSLQVCLLFQCYTHV